MARPATEVTAGIDRRWVEDQARHEPIAHAYALWDLDHAPDRTEFWTYRSGGLPTAYLLVWRGIPASPMVHWVGDESALDLLAALPPRPLVAVVPEPLADRVVGARGPGTVYRTLIMARDVGAGTLRPDGGARRLVPTDADEFRRFTATPDPEIGRGYGGADLVRLTEAGESVWGVFDGDRLVGTARTPVHMPAVWLVSGVVVAATHRNQGLGSAILSALLRAADAEWVRCALYVRADNAPALKVYERLGFVAIARRAWIDLGSGRAP